MVAIFQERNIVLGNQKVYRVKIVLRHEVLDALDMFIATTFWIRFIEINVTWIIRFQDRNIPSILQNILSCYWRVDVLPRAGSFQFQPRDEFRYQQLLPWQDHRCRFRCYTAIFAIAVENSFVDMLSFAGTGSLYFTHSFCTSFKGIGT